jgi:ribosomal protein L10
MVTKAKKQERVASLEGLMTRSQLAVVSDFTGLNVKDMTELRRRLQAVGGDYTIAKNTLVKKALQDSPILAEAAPLFKGPSGLILGFDDPVGPVKVLVDYQKEKKRDLGIRGGVLEGRRVSPADLQAIATLPSREEMIAKLMGSMQSPAQGVVVTLSGVARNLVQVLEAVRKQKEN